MQVTALNVYPVKSMRGFAVEEATVEAQGFAGDREWLLTDANGRFRTAREIERMLLWRPEPTATGLRLHTPHGECLDVHRADFTRPDPVVVWRDGFQAYGGPADVDAWLSAQFGLDCRLFYLGAVPQRVLVVNAGALSFADGAPYLLTTEASLAQLNQQLSTPVSMRRFRANIVIDGMQAYAEDTWHRLRIGDIEFTGFKPCGRCKIVNLDPDTAELSAMKEPLKTLAKTHQLSEGACFGVNYYAHSNGILRVGDRVELLDSGH